MKVKISYTTEYEKVPKLIDNLIGDCCSRFASYSKLELSLHRLEDFVREVRIIQDDLSLISDQLNDCINLAAGYINVGEGQEDADVVNDIEQELLVPEDAVDERD
tara:strand:- start:306 stop:620 length:315 start_codon:yes stop_codon:yes gene_type:complete